MGFIQLAMEYALMVSLGGEKGATSMTMFNIYFEASTQVWQKSILLGIIPLSTEHTSRVNILT